MRGRLLNWEAVLRLLGYIAAAGALIAAAVFLGRHMGPPAAPVHYVDPTKETNALVRELLRCSALGEKAKDDPACFIAWHENNKRFFGVSDNARAGTTLGDIP